MNVYLNILFNMNKYIMIIAKKYFCTQSAEFFGTQPMSDVKVSSQVAEGEKFKLIDLDVTLIINPDDCQTRQVITLKYSNGPRH